MEVVRVKFTVIEDMSEEEILQAFGDVLYNMDGKFDWSCFFETIANYANREEGSVDDSSKENIKSFLKETLNKIVK